MKKSISSPRSTPGTPTTQRSDYQIANQKPDFSANDDSLIGQSLNKDDQSPN